MTTFATKFKAKCREWASPLLNSTVQERKRWLFLTVICSAAAVGAEVWFYDNYRIAWDRQILRCLDARFLLVDLKSKPKHVNAIERNKIYAYTSAQSAPIIT